MRLEWRAKRLLDAVEQPPETATRRSGDRDDRRSLPKPILKARPNVLDPDGRRVPLREDDEGRAVRLARDVGDGEILVDEPLRRIDQDEGDVGLIGGGEGAELGVVLDALALAPFAPQARGVDEDERRVAAPEDGVDRVPRRPGLVGHDHAFLTEERVQEARLPDVRPAEDRNPDRLFADLGRPRTGKLRDDPVEEIAGSVAVSGRERNGIAQAEAVKLERVRVAVRIVELVRDQDHALSRAPEDLRDLLVARSDPGASRRRRTGRDRTPRRPGAPARPRPSSAETRRRRPRRRCRRGGNASPTTRRRRPCDRASRPASRRRPRTASRSGG